MATITVTGTYEDSSGTPLSGTVSFTPVATGTDGVAVFLEDPVTAKVTGGVLSKVVTTTDTWDVDGAVTYRVVERVGSTGRSKFYAQILSSMGASVDITDLQRYANPPNQIQIDSGAPVDFTSHLTTDHQPILDELADHETRIDDLEAATLPDFYQLPVDGIPQADLDAATEAKLDGAIQKSLADAKGDLIAATGADVVARLPIGSNNQVLTADSTQSTGMKWAAPAVGSAIPPSIVDVKGDLIVGTASDTVARLAAGTNGHVLTADSTQTAGVKWAAAPTDATKADKSGGLSQFADVDDTAPADGDVLMWDSGAGAYVPTNLSTLFAGLDANGRLAASAEPEWYREIVVINEGDVPPGTFPAQGLVGTLPAAPSLVPTLLDVDSVRAANNVVLQFPNAQAIGDYIGFSIGWENSSGLDHFTIAFGGSGAGTGTFDQGTLSVPNTTAGVLNGFVKLTGAASAASTITFTAKNSSDAAINRAHLIAAIYLLPNLAASSPRDQQAVGGGSSSSDLAAITAAITSNTAQNDEIAIGASVHSSGTSPQDRDIAGTNGWAQLVKHKSDNASNGRTLYVGYKVLTAVGQPTFNTLVTLAGGATQTGIWASKLDTYKSI